MWSADNLSPIRPSSKDGNITDADGKKRVPPPPPVSGQPFKHIMEKKGTSQEEEDSKYKANVKKRKPFINIEKGTSNIDVDTVAENENQTSIYNRANVRKDAPKQPVKDSDEEIADLSTDRDEAPREVKESPFSLYKKVAVNKDKPATTRPFAMEASTEAPFSNSKTNSSKSTDKTTSKFSEEQTELNNVNPFAAIQGMTERTSGQEEISKPQAISNIKELVTQLVKELQVIERQGQTDTIVTINHPSLFQDARVIITSFDSASKEFNLAFENLTQQAKQVIDQNLMHLRSNLEEKGYANVIHIITTTTIVEHTMPGEDRQNFAWNQDREQQQQKKEQDEEENT